MMEANRDVTGELLDAIGRILLIPEYGGSRIQIEWSQDGPIKVIAPGGNGEGKTVAEAARGALAAMRGGLVVELKSHQGAVASLEGLLAEFPEPTP